MAAEVFEGSSDPLSPRNGAYVAGVHAASTALVLNAVLMSCATYAIPRAMALLGRGRLWCGATVVTALLLVSSLAIKRSHAKARGSEIRRMSMGKGWNSGLYGSSLTF